MDNFPAGIRLGDVRMVDAIANETNGKRGNI
jgi:hypothetical protein